MRRRPSITGTLTIETNFNMHTTSDHHIDNEPNLCLLWILRFHHLNCQTSFRPVISTSTDTPHRPLKLPSTVSIHQPTTKISHIPYPPTPISKSPNPFSFSSPFATAFSCLTVFFLLPVDPTLVPAQNARKPTTSHATASRVCSPLNVITPLRSPHSRSRLGAKSMITVRC